MTSALFMGTDFGLVGGMAGVVAGPILGVNSAKYKRSIQEFNAQLGNTLQRDLELLTIYFNGSEQVAKTISETIGMVNKLPNPRGALDLIQNYCPDLAPGALTLVVAANGASQVVCHNPDVNLTSIVEEVNQWREATANAIELSEFGGLLADLSVPGIGALFTLARLCHDTTSQAKAREAIVPWLYSRVSLVNKLIKAWNQTGRGYVTEIVFTK